MSSWRWKTGLVYLILGIVLFGVSTFFFGDQEKMDNLPTGTEVVGQGIEERSESSSGSIKEPGNYIDETIIKEQEEFKNQQNPKTEAERIKAELALVGIKTAEKRPSTPVQEAPHSKDRPRTLKDFPSPVQGKLIRAAGNYFSESLQAYLFHAGTDYAQSEGAVIRIKHSGKVTYAGADPILGGKVEIDGGENWSVIYGGLQNLRVKEGDPVEVNQAIGQVGYYPGADGVKDQPQLHFEVWHGDEVQIPIKN